VTSYGVRTEYDRNEGRKRDHLTVWSGPWYSVYEAAGVSLPRGDGYMLTTYNGKKVRVTCPTPRTDENYQQIDAAVSAALNADRLEYLRTELRTQCISYGELAELQDLAEYIDPGDVELLEAAGVPEALAYMPIADRMRELNA
jgi:hypothetical protein